MPKQTPTTHSSKTLENVVNSLRKAASDIESAMTFMGEQELSEVVVLSGNTEMKRALKRIEVFRDHLLEAIHNAREHRGDFGAGIVENESPKKAKRKGS